MVLANDLFLFYENINLLCIRIFFFFSFLCFVLATLVLWHHLWILSVSEWILPLIKI